MPKTTKKVELTKNSKKVNNNTPLNFPIVGIGASAGGLEALEQFFTHLPIVNGMAFVVIQHLDPTHVGMLPELLQRTTSMKVFQVTDGLIVKPDCVYVIPPNKSMSILNNTLFLSEPIETRGLRLPIDFFFNSLAEYKKENAIGIILSGMGSDGSLGLKAIKDFKGLALVQDPATAKFDGMPKSAIDSVVADVTASAEGLPVKLLDLLMFIPTIKPDVFFKDKLNKSLDEIVYLLQQQTGHDFSLYKKNTLFRRIERRKGVHQIDKINNYASFLKENPKEIEILFKEILIGVTSFFRDTSVWEKLKNEILPDYLSKLPRGYVVRIWVTGCSTGEEAYSWAIIFKEIIDKLENNCNISLQIFATDLDINAIEIARKGLFSLNIKKDVSSERLKKYFTLENDQYRVNSVIRELIVFAPQNVIKDPPFTKLDIISCRNLLIYLEPVLQQKVISLFNYSLNPSGILLLGSAESISIHNAGFEEICSKLKIFKRNLSNLMTNQIDLPSSFYQKIATTQEKNTTITKDNIQSLIEHIMLNNYIPASVLVNENGDIIYITGHTGKYLEPAAGKANWNIYSMARDGLRNELPTAFRKAKENSEPFSSNNIKINLNGSTLYLNLIIQQLNSPDTLKGKYLVVFKDIQESIQTKQTTPNSKKNSSLIVNELETELKQCYLDLNNTLEEMKTSQEELKTTNEELQSTNEELQSTNEELTTSKEEMQSLNEELQIVNLELQNKVNDFMLENDDMKNLLNSTEIATLFLDKELNIRRFTDQATQIFKLRKTDIGRPITELVNDLKYPNIEKDAWDVINKLIPIEREIETNDKRWFCIRIMPYRTLDDRIDGLVITLTNISKSKMLEIELKKIKNL